MAYPLQPVLDALHGMRDEWPGLCTNPKLKFEGEVECIIKACEKSDYATKVALANIPAVQTVLRDCAMVGVTMQPAHKLAYCLPRDEKMVYDVSWMGLIHLAVEEGAIQWAKAHRVYANETYEPQGYDVPPIHKRKPFAKPEERGELVGVYVVAKTPSGDYLTDEMPIEEVNSIRDRSPSWKKNQSGPWKTDPGEMQKKTVVKRAAKWWRAAGGSERLEKAIHYLNTDGGQGMDLTHEDEAKTRLDIFRGKLANAKTGDEVAAIWKQREEFKAANDLAGYEEFKKLVAARNKELGVTPPANGNGTAKPEPSSGTQAGQAAPQTRGTPPAAKPSPEAAILADIEKAGTYDDLNAIAERIDALAAGELQNECNDAWNERLAVLKKKFGHA